MSRAIAAGLSPPISSRPTFRCKTCLMASSAGGRIPPRGSARPSVIRSSTWRRPRTFSRRPPALPASSRRSMPSWLAVQRCGATCAPGLVSCSVPIPVPRRGGQKSSAASCPRPKLRCCCPRTSATTPISTRQFSTPPMSARCSGPTSRSSRITNGCPSVTTGAVLPSSSAAHRYAGPSDVGLAGRRPNSTRETPQQAAGNVSVFKPVDAPAPRFGPCQNLDYELELGVFVGPGNPLGERIPLAQAADHLFGVVLLNDWSARDIQTWEYQPLGPFLAKNFATTISPWVVTMEALALFRVPAFPRLAGEPAPLPYLPDATDQGHGGLDLMLEVWLLTAQMRAAGHAPHRLSSGSFQKMYWTLAQLLTHHASNGCNLQPRDLLGSRTLSGETKDSRGCLLELAWRGTEPFKLSNGEERKFLQDGDEVILRGYCERPGTRRIGLGECRGLVLPAGN